MSIIAPHADRSPMRLDNDFYEIQTEARSADLIPHGAAATIKRIEDMGLLRGWNARTSIRHAQLHPPIAMAGRKADPPALRPMFQRIVNQIPNHVAQCRFLSRDRRKRTIEPIVDDYVGL